MVLRSEPPELDRGDQAVGRIRKKYREIVITHIKMPGRSMMYNNSKQEYQAVDTAGLPVY